MLSLPFATFAATLRETFAPAFKVGAALNARAFARDGSPVGRLAAREFSSITAENEMKPMSLQPREGEFCWETADKFVAFGERHGKDVSFFYAEAGKDWQSLGDVQDASILSTDYAGGFVAATIGPFVIAK